MFVSSLREFPENCCELNCFIEYLHRKLLTSNFLSYDIESAKKSAFIVCVFDVTLTDNFQYHSPLILIIPTGEIKRKCPNLFSIK